MDHDKVTFTTDEKSKRTSEINVLLSSYPKLDFLIVFMGLWPRTLFWPISYTCAAFWQKK